MKYSEIENAKVVLNKVGAYLLPRKLTVAIVRNGQKLDEIMKLIQSQKEEVAKKYARRDDKGNFILEGTGANQRFTFESEEKVSSYLSELNEVMALEENIDFIKVSASVLDECETKDNYHTFTANEEIELGFMIDYEE